MRQAGPGRGIPAGCRLGLSWLKTTAGAIECRYYTEDNSAIAGYDYVEA